MIKPFFTIFICAWVLSCSTAQKAPVFHLDTLEYRTFKWFWDLADQDNYQIPDRWPNHQFSSIAATGFGLSAYIVGAERGFVTRSEAADRTLKTLQVLWELPQNDSYQGSSGYRGFYYHFLDKNNAKRFKDTELSTIDTGLLMAGVLAAMSYYDRPEEEGIRKLADQIYRRVEYNWMLNPENRISMGWRPERGFIHSDWQGYNEAMILLIQALGSPDYSVDDELWEQWCSTYDWRTYQGQEMINFGPLFGHQYSHIFIDFRNILDKYTTIKGIDYFENSRRATLANRAYCIENPQGFQGYHKNSWGLSACDGPADDLRKAKMSAAQKQYELSKFGGYSARGASAKYLNDDGTLTPTAVGGSIPFAPEECISTLRYFWETHYEHLVDEHGFKDAFNLNTTFEGQRPQGWFAEDKLGIDQGAILLMIANYKDGIIWNQLKKNPYIIRGLKRAGFRGGWLEPLETPDYPQKIHEMSNEQIPADPHGLFEYHIHNSGSDGPELPYRMMRPKDYRESDRYPLVIFLHGAGERGDDNRSQLKNGVMTFAENQHRASFPAFVIAPQCPKDMRWSTVDTNWRAPQFPAEPTPPLAAVITLIQELLEQEPGIDPERIYVCGLSMGGFGGFDLLARKPEWFSGALLLCGGAHDDVASKISRIPIRVFHCSTDMTVSVENSRAIVKKLESIKAPVFYTEYNTLGHHIWQETFYNPANLQWLFKQNKQLTYDR